MRVLQGLNACERGCVTTIIVRDLDCAWGERIASCSSSKPHLIHLTSVNPLQVARKEAEPGLGISRLEAGDFCRLMRVAAFFTAHTRLVAEKGPAPAQKVWAGRGWRFEG